MRFVDWTNVYFQCVILEVRMIQTGRSLQLVLAEIELHVAGVLVLSCRVVHEVTHLNLKMMKTR